MSKRIIFFLFLLLSFALIFTSCSADVSVSVREKELSMLEKMNADSENAMSLLGKVKSFVAFNGSSSKGFSDFEIQQLDADLDGIKSTYHIVYYESIHQDILTHLNTVPKKEYQIPGIKNKVNAPGLYAVIFRSCYLDNKDKATAAFRKIYVLDKGSVSADDDILLQEVSFSPDFEYDIDNQLEVSTGKPVKYNWNLSKTEEADRFVESNEDLSALVDGIAAQWLLVDSSGNTIKDEYSDGTYILKVSKTEAENFRDFEIGSFTSEYLRIENYIYSEPDAHDYAFFFVQKYPENFRHSWSVMCYWYNSGAWHYTRGIQTDEDLIPIWYKNVTSTELNGFFPEAKAIGNITRIYQAYKGSNPYLENDFYKNYVVEYNSANKNLRTVIENKDGKSSTSKSSWAGRLRADTVAYAYLSQNTNTNTLSACIAVVGDYTSYTYLPLTMLDNRLLINKIFLDTADSISYEKSTGKYRDISKYDKSLYYSEYDGADKLVETLEQLGNITEICYYTGNTGQTKPHINTYSDSPNIYVSIAAQFSTFDQDILESKMSRISNNTRFTVGSKVYNLDYEKAGITTVELDVFFKASTGEVTSVQIRKVTNPSAIKTDNYAVTYVMKDSFLITNDSVQYSIQPRFYTYNPETGSSYGGNKTYSTEFKRYVTDNDMQIICYPHSIYMAYILGGGTGTGSPDYAYREAFYWYLNTYKNISYEDLCRMISDGLIDNWLKKMTDSYPAASSNDVSGCSQITVSSAIPEKYSDSDILEVRNVFFYKPDKNFLSLAGNSPVTSSTKTYIVTDDWDNKHFCWLFLPYSYLELYESNHSAWDGSYHIFRDYLVYKGIISESEKSKYSNSLPVSILKQLFTVADNPYVGTWSYVQPQTASGFTRISSIVFTQDKFQMIEEIVVTDLSLARAWAKTDVNNPLPSEAEIDNMTEDELTVLIGKKVLGGSTVPCGYTEPLSYEIDENGHVPLQDPFAPEYELSMRIENEQLIFVDGEYETHFDKSAVEKQFVTNLMVHDVNP